MHFNEADGIIFTRTNLIHFWAPCLAAVAREKMADEQNILWIANDADGVWADALLTAALTLIVRTAGAMVRSFTGFPINVSEMNRTLFFLF